MGIVEKQTLKGSIWSYIGALIGFVNVALLMPKLFSTEEVGLINVLIAISTIIAQFGTLGINGTSTRIFPYFRNGKENHYGFPFISAFIVLLGGGVSFILCYFLRDTIISQNIDKAPMLVEHLSFLIPLSIVALLFNLFDSLNRIFLNAVLGTFLKEIVFRILTLILIVLFYFKSINFIQFLYLYTFSLAIPPLFLFINLIVKERISFKPDLRMINKSMIKQITILSIYSIISGFSGLLISSIDKYMITSKIGLDSAGIYSVAFYFGSLIVLPSRALKKISAPILGEAWKRNDLEEVNTIYTKSSLYQSIVGLILFFGVWLNLDNIFNILPDEYTAGRLVIIIVGATNLLDMLSGVSGTIIGNSQYYKLQSFFLLLLATLIVITNLIFIPIFGLTGAAIASLCSNIVFVILKGIFIYSKWKLYPFDFKHLWIFVSITIAFLVSHLSFEHFDLWILDIFVRSSLFLILSTIMNYKLLTKIIKGRL